MEEKIVEEICEKYGVRKKFVELLIKICVNNKIENSEEIKTEVTRCVKKCVKERNTQQQTY